MTHVPDKNIQWYLSSFEEFERGLNGESKHPAHALRKAAMARFAEIGFPTVKNEEWRFTSIAPILKTQFVQLTRPTKTVGSEQLEPFFFPSIRLVFVDGCYVPEFSSNGSLPAGVRVTTLGQMLPTDDEVLFRHLGKYIRHDENGFTALNAGFIRDGAFVDIPEGVPLESPIHLLFVSSGGDIPFTTAPRNVIVVGKRSEVSLVESYVGVTRVPYLTNTVTEVVVGDGAVVEHDKFQDERPDAFHVGTTVFHQHAGSRVVSNSIALGGSIVRNTVTAVLAGEHIESTLNGLSLGTGTQVIDNHTAIDHAMPNCTSHELYKTILDGRSRGVFNGKIFVRKDAQKTDAKQTNKTLVLSDEATMDTKPQLEIFADDVKCTHGATVGQLDDEQVFYLRSRGLSLNSARDILTFAFASDVIKRIHVPPLREQLDAMIQQRLRRGREIARS
jgi:Fe-S cluster assembly protein SufD